VKPALIEVRESQEVGESRNLLLEVWLTPPEQELVSDHVFAGSGGRLFSPGDRDLNRELSTSLPEASLLGEMNSSWGSNDLR